MGGGGGGGGYAAIGPVSDTRGAEYPGATLGEPPLIALVA